MITGSVQAKNGKYYVVLNLYENGKRKPKWISTGLEIKGNKKKAEQFLRDKIREFELKSNLISTDVLFSDYVKHWLNVKQPTVNVITYNGYLDLARTHIIPYFANLNIKLVDVTREVIQEYINEKHQNGKLDGSGGLSPKSIKSQMIIIKQTLDEAVKSNLISTNPYDLISLPQHENYQANFYNTKQLETLFDCIKNEPLYPLIYITVILGLRKSEVLGLKWDSIDYDSGLITVKHTVVKQLAVYEKDTTKNKSSHRSFPLSDDIIKILSTQKKQEIENQKLFGREYIKNDYIFKWDNGKPYSPDYVSSKFSKLLKKYNLPHIRFHDLRHSCASILVSKGFTLKDIQEWLGHADIKTTADIYAHLDIERKTNISNTLSSTFNV